MQICYSFVNNVLSPDRIKTARGKEVWPSTMSVPVALNPDPQLMLANSERLAKQVVVSAATSHLKPATIHSIKQTPNTRGKEPLVFAQSVPVRIGCVERKVRRESFVMAHK